jgi:hypothetical protein
VARVGSETCVSVAVSKGSLADLIDRVAERARLKLQWSAAARKAADECEAALAWQDVPVSDVLIDLILPLAKTEDGRWTSRAQLKLAEIAVRENRPQEALQVCRKVLEDKQTVKRETVLLLMGQAYEKASEYRQAARCYSGQLPE